MSNGNGAKFGDGMNAWLKQNWLLLSLIIGATIGYTRMDFRMQQMQEDIAELKTQGAAANAVAVEESRQETRFQNGMIEYLDRDLAYHFPHKEKK